jgi:hypothetical protein
MRWSRNVVSARRRSGSLREIHDSICSTEHQRRRRLAGEFIRFVSDRECEEWDALDQETLDALIRSIPERSRLCIKHARECISVYMKHRPPIRDIASPPRCPHSPHDQCGTYRRRGSVSGSDHVMHDNDRNGEKCFRLQDESSFPLQDQFTHQF